MYFYLPGSFAYSDQGDVISSLLLFNAERLHLSLEVGGPWLTGKHKLRQTHADQR